MPLSGVGRLPALRSCISRRRHEKVPYGIAYVDLPEGVRVFGKLADADSARWKLDQQVRIDVATVPGAEDQAPQYQYFFNAV